MARSTSGLIIAGTHSGCGKTQVALGLAAALAGRGLTVQGFKVGPDFIDPSHMSAITGRAAHNLDGWMLSRETVLELYRRNAAGVDFCVVEGVMGLFDGASGTDEAGSTAQMAKWLDLPVVLVVDARSQGRSVAAVLGGFRSFDPALRLAGVLLTRVGGPGHEHMLRATMNAYHPDFPCLGFLPRRNDLTLPSRHLGLHMAQDVGWKAKQRSALSSWLEQNTDIPALMALAGNHVPSWPDPDGNTVRPCHFGAESGRIRLAVANDQAFCFYYQENLDLLRRAGADLLFFSPLNDERLPDDIHGMYLGGGYPELHARELSNNMSMRQAICRAARDGMPVYAECGGLLYLLSEVEDASGATYPMAGFFPHRAKMHPRFQALGYREAFLAATTLLGPKGSRLCGHEFHYSALCAIPDEVPQQAYLARDRHGREFSEGFIQGNVLASFIHLHFSSRPQSAQDFVAACMQWAQEHSSLLNERSAIRTD